jgi:hypothetical protein
VTAGAGWYRTVYSFSDQLAAQYDLSDRAVSDFGWHLGLGARVAVAPRFSLYGEGRYVFLDPGRHFSGPVQEAVRNLDYNSVYLAGGFNVHF